MNKSILKVKVRAYSSSANLGPGFDVTALCLDAYCDEVEAELVNEKRVRIIEVEGEEGISKYRNTAKYAVDELLRRLNVEKGVNLKIKKGIPIGKGLGSSGATAAAAVYAVNKLLGSPLKPEDLIDVAAYAEGKIAGSPHADNVAASLLGGFIVITSIKPFKAISLSSPKDFKFLTVIPNIKFGKRKTERARKVLPKYVSFQKFVKQTSSLAKLIVGFLKENEEMVGEAMSSELIVESSREKAGLVPLYREVREIAFKNRALGVCVSGAGPSILILCKEYSKKLESELKKLYNEEKIEVEIKRAKVAPGAHVI